MSSLIKGAAGSAKTVGNLALHLGSNAAASAVRSSEGVFVNSANLMARGVGKPKAKTLNDAFKMLFPHWGGTQVMGVTETELRGMLHPSFVMENDRNISNFHKAATLKNGITRQELISNIQGNAIVGPVTTETADNVAKLQRAHITADARSFGLNPTVARRLIVGTAAIGILKNSGTVFSADLPDPTVYYDGTDVRHVKDLGANGAYGRAIMRRSR